MAMRAIRLFGDPVLTSPALPVTSFDDALAVLVRDLLDSLDAPGRAGLAAPQVGVGLRVFSYAVHGERGYVVNPELIDVSALVDEGPEGCLSLPGLWHPTARASAATVRGVDLRGEPVTVSGAGLLARCLQHEVDHLDGRLFLDRLDVTERRRALRAVREADWFRHGR